MRIKKILITLMLCFYCLLISAQESGQSNFGFWGMYFGTNKVSEKLSIHSEAQYRTYEFVSNFNQLLLRTGVNYQISDNATVTLGYGYISTDPTFSEFDSEKKIIEHRIFQQFSLRNTVGRFVFSHRYRIEQRFIDIPLAGSVTEHRGRYLLRITYPLNDDWFLTAYDEVFINFQEPIFGQNRLYGAVGYKFNKDVSMQFGYLKNHFTGVNFDRLQIGIWWNTDLRKKSQKKTDE